MRDASIRHTLTLIAAAAASFGCSAATGDPGAVGNESVSASHQALNTTPGEGLYRISPQIAPHKSFDLPGLCPGQSNGAPLALYRFDGAYCSDATGDQKWYLRYAGNNGQNYYEIRQGTASGKCLDGYNGQGNAVYTWDCAGVPWQRWYFDEMTPGPLYGLWRIRNVSSGLTLDLANGYSENGTKIQLWTDNGTQAQRWVLSNANAAILKEDFSDDFTNIDGNVWNLAQWYPGFVNGELQSYSPSQIWADGHVAHIDAKWVGPGTGSGAYVSGRMNTKNKRYYRNGAWSARIHYYEWGSGNTKGAWPAFWFLGNGINEDAVYASRGAGACWPTYNARELDVWEYPSNNDNYHFTAGHSGNGCGSDSYAPAQSNWFDQTQWAVYKVIFGQDNNIHFYRDGQALFSFPSGNWVDQDMYALFNVAVGGSLGGNTVDFNGSDDGAGIQVDWVAHEYW